MKVRHLATAISISILSTASVQAAKYRVVELPTVDLAAQGFGADINSQSDVVANGISIFNPVIDLEFLDLESEFFVENLTDIDAVKAGDPNTEDLLFLYNYVKSNADSQFIQQIAGTQAFKIVGDSAEPVKGHDATNDVYEFLEYSVDVIANGVGANGEVVGTAGAPFYKRTYQLEDSTELDYVVQDFSRRGFVEINGMTVSLPPVDTTAGGISDAFDINNSLQVAGFGAVSSPDTFKSAVEICDTDARGDIPKESCLQSLFTSGIDTAFQRRAMIWQLNDAGEVVDVKTFGLLSTPAEDDTRIFSSGAVAINDNGIAVGASNQFFQDDETNVREYAAIFEGDSVTAITDQEEYLGSTATDINNNNIVVGQAIQLLNGATRTKIFVHDMNDGTTVYPQDFFNSSSGVARAINDNGLVVGEGEVETSNTQRRREGFIYDINTEEFTNLNDLLACNSPYTIVQGNGINNDDEIVATAVVFRQGKDIKGNGEQDDQGNAIDASTTIAVKLVPIPGGEVDDCTEFEDDKFERSGGSTGIIGLTGLALLALFRRRKG